MPRTLGYHWVKSGYGLWLPGDSRGHWSEAYDDQIGYYQPHMLHPGDPVRLRMARERMTHPEVKLTAPMLRIVERIIGWCADQSPWKIVAASIESTHTHLLLTCSALDVHRTVKWIAQETTKAIHRETDHQGPGWGKGDWTVYLFDDVSRHSVAMGPCGILEVPSPPVVSITSTVN